MTENEAIKWQESFKETYKGFPKDVDVACDIAINALEEIQQYRDLGTVEELRLAKEKQIPKKPIQKNDRSFKDRQCFYCPNCKDSLATNEDDTYYNYWLNHCDNCGQAIDWSDTD